MTTPLPLLLLIILAAFDTIAQKQATTPEIKLINLYDAFGRNDKGLTMDFGFSCLIEYQGKTVLFDAGTDARIFESNLKALNIDLSKVDVAILSHGHYDHQGGMDHLVDLNPNVKIYLPNDFFSLGAPTKFPFREAEPDAAKSLPPDERYFNGEKVVEGMITTPTGRFWKSNVEYITTAKEIMPGFRLIPTTSALMGTFIKYPPFENNPQFIGLPELSLSVQTSKGQVIVTGCSHSTIETIVQQSTALIKDEILLVTGGFHLIPYSRVYIEGLAKRMKDEYKIKNVAPAHCTGHLGFSILKDTFREGYHSFGLGKSLEL
jgi:7,8-dihydropterin-6-yl-methyl-4-(beta-D-ribofuranosyl)aminobenzene 5'-phosphate synthase